MPVGYKGIDLNDPFLQQLEILMEEKNQFFYVADIIRMRVIFTSKRSTQIIGIEAGGCQPLPFYGRSTSR